VTGPPGGGKNRQKLTVVRAGLPCICFRPRADSWTAPSREDTVMKLHPRSAARSLVFAGVMAIAVAGFLAVEPSRVLSQGVAMVKVDVSLVAKGYRASKLIGSGVVNDKNEKIGTLDDIIIDHSRVMAGVLQVGGFLGIGSRRVAVPYEDLQIDDTGRKIVLPEATREELQKLAEFNYES
jgi:sporulation protein YlmC with PRC-barrel domain